MVVWLSLFWLAIAALTIVIRGGRDRRSGYSAMLHEAVARVRAGEQGVRILASRCGAEARAASMFNAVIQEIETGAVDTFLRAGNDTVYEELRSELAVHLRRGHAATTFVAITEIERFSALRQSIGYSLGNKVLAVMSRRIADQVDGAEIGRIGRTTIEFAFPAASAEAAQACLARAIAPIEHRVEIEGYEFELSVNIGFADAGATSIRDELVDHAAAALAAARAERQKVRFADAAILAQRSFADLELMRALPLAMANEELTLHYQPKLGARTNRVTSVEALLRWVSPMLGAVPTDRFITVAEETGAIRDLTEWVVERAIADQNVLAAAGHEIEIYINLSGQLLPDAEFCGRLLDIVAEAPGRIGFEITETAVITDPAAALANLAAFSAAGIRIAIDDYGSGLSSLAYLKQLPADELKIDRMFISGLTESHRDPLLVRSSIDLAHALEMEVTAEGVDDPIALSLLRIMGCDLLQGYLISPPIPVQALIEFLGDTTHLDQLGEAGAAPQPWQQAS